MEKMALALVHNTRKLPHYFQTHMVYVLIEHPLQVFLMRLDFMRRITKKGIRLGYFNVRYRPRNAITGQVLVDFIAEFTSPVDDVHRVYQVSIRPWKMYVDGASNARGARIGIVLESLEGIVNTSPHNFLCRPHIVVTLAHIYGGGVSHLGCVTGM